MEKQSYSAEQSNVVAHTDFNAKFFYFSAVAAYVVLKSIFINSIKEI